MKGYKKFIAKSASDSAELSLVIIFNSQNHKSVGLEETSTISKISLSVQIKPPTEGTVSAKVTQSCWARTATCFSIYCALVSCSLTT